MILICCIDNNYGMTFNNRRQSRDREVIKDIASHFTGRMICMEGYSAPLFDGVPAIKTEVQENMFSNTIENEIYFAERNLPDPGVLRPDTVILYHWNRHYPAQTYFNMDLLNGMRLISTSEFVGNSHEKITKEIWKRGLENA